jgi:hypothetical protein
MASGNPRGWLGVAKTKTRPKTKKRSAADRYGSQVGAESTLKFGPEESSLRAALDDAGAQRDQAFAGAAGVRAAIEGSAKAALPQLQGSYGTAQRAVDQVQQSLAGALAGTPLSGAASRDASGTKQRLAEALAAAEAETISRQRDAASGEAFARQNAQAQYATAAGKVRTRQQDLAREEGAFAQGRTGELVESARGRSVTRRGQDLTAASQRAQRRTSNKNTDAALEETARHNRQAEANAKDKNHKSTLAKPADVETARTRVQRALDAARTVAGEVSSGDKAAGKKQRDRAETAKILVNGRGGQTIKNDPKSGDPLANPIKVPGVKQQDQLYASVALDILYDGRLSKGNQARLRRLGLTPKMLGVPPAFSGQPERPGTAPAGRTGGRGQQRPT